jgi:hypothetical protein
MSIYEDDIGIAQHFNFHTKPLSIIKLIKLPLGYNAKVLFTVRPDLNILSLST